MGQQTVTAVSIICVLHYFFGIVVPLVMSVVLNTFGLLDDPLVRIYLRDHSPEYNKTLQRPFKLANPMDNMKKFTEGWSWAPTTEEGSAETEGETERRGSKDKKPRKKK